MQKANIKTAHMRLTKWNQKSELKDVTNEAHKLACNLHLDLKISEALWS